MASLCAAPAWSQATSSASISGLVTNEKGAAVSGAEVKLLDPATATAQTTHTNGAGRYAFPQVQGGIYTVTAAKEGFSVFRISSQPVEEGTPLTIDVVLKAGSATTFVEAQPVGAQSGSTMGGTVGSKSLSAAPTLGNEAASLTTLQAGTTSSGNTGGAFSDQNVFMLDGGSISDDFAGNMQSNYNVNYAGLGGTQQNGMPSGIVPTSVETVEQVRVSTFGQSADSATIGSQSQMVTKHGTNQYHGAAYGSYFGSNWGGANTWVNNHTPSVLLHMPYTPLPITHRSRFGGSLGGVLLPELLGSKTYFFVNYEGSRFPNSYIFTTLDPSFMMRAGVIQIPNSAGVYMPYNLNPSPVTVNGTTYQPAMCGTGLCDPRGIGISPVIKQIWGMMPPPNEFQYSGDLYNVQGFNSPVTTPLKQNSYVARIDHNLSPKERFFGSWRYTRIANTTAGQVDIGGIFPGDTFGKAAPVFYKTQHPSFMVYGLTSNPRPNMTNDFRFSYTRNQWQWSGQGAPPQLAGLGGAVEPGGEGTTSLATNSTANGILPYNVNENSVRQRLWDGQDKLLKDDLTIIKGKHLLQMGGSWMRMNLAWWKDDNPQGMINHIVYQVTSANTNFQGFPYPSTVPTNQQTAWNTYYAYALGMVSQSQLNVIRNQQLQVLPTGSFALLQNIIPTYNTYVSDTWRIKPSVTFVYGLGYMVQMPPYATKGVQSGVVDQNGNQIYAQDYLNQRQKAALSGQAYDPILGWANPPNMSGKPKYPYDPFYGGLSPRFSVAWTPNFSDGILRTLLGDKKTVLRAGYGRMLGRMNAIRTMSSAVQGPGEQQAISCAGPSITGQCTGNNGVTPSTVFRIGPDGLTVPLPAVTPVLAQPYYAGVNGNTPTVDNGYLDRDMRPQRSDNLTVTLSRQISNRMSVDVGYIGRIIRHEMLTENLDSLPYMMTLGGQTFASAFAHTFFNVPQSGALPSGFTVPAQPFFETALGGAGSAYCQGYANCTTAVAFKNTTAIRNTAVSDLWTGLYNAPSWTLGRVNLSQPLGPGLPNQGYSWVAWTANGWSNYNALYLTYRVRDYHGFSGTSNFTWGRALGTPTQEQSSSGNTMADGYNLRNNYGQQSYDVKFIYNFSLTYAPKVFVSQKGVLGHVLGGWSLAPILQAQSGNPVSVRYSEGGCTACQAFGQVSTTSSGYAAITENAQAIAPLAVSTTASYNQNANSSIVASGVGSNNPTGVNRFANPAAVVADFRKCVLGFDADCAGYPTRGLPFWNMDLGVRKSVKVWKESAGAELRVNFTNVFNHPQMSTPTLTITSPTSFGRVTSVMNTPRQLQAGLRLYF